MALELFLFLQEQIKGTIIVDRLVGDFSNLNIFCQICSEARQVRPGGREGIWSLRKFMDTVDIFIHHPLIPDTSGCAWSSLIRVFNFRQGSFSDVESSGLQLMGDMADPAVGLKTFCHGKPLNWKFRGFRCIVMEILNAPFETLRLSTVILRTNIRGPSGKNMSLDLTTWYDLKISKKWDFVHTKKWLDHTMVWTKKFTLWSHHVCLVHTIKNLFTPKNGFVHTYQVCFHIK